MSRFLTIAAAQSGPVARTETRAEVVRRLVEQMRAARARGAELIVFTECALTPFFPHWFMAEESELDSWFETAVPGPTTRPLFEVAARLGIGFCLGYAEIALEDGGKHRYNSSVLVDRRGQVVGRFRKVHLPGHVEHRPHNPFQNLEKRYFEPGNLGFPTWPAFGGVVGMCICNDRRWPETYRVLGLRGAEVILIGYNTPAHIPEHPELDALANFHNHLCMQAGAHQNGAWVVGVAKAGVEEGVSQIGQSCIISPSGEVIAMAATLEDELVIHRCDLDLTRPYKEYLFQHANRRPGHYGPITDPTGSPSHE